MSLNLADDERSVPVHRDLFVIRIGRSSDESTYRSLPGIPGCSEK